MQINLRAQATREKPWLAPQILKVMKLTAILMTIACLQVSAKAFSQITLSGNNIPLSTVFAEVQKQSGYSFFYKDKIVENIKVNANLHDASLDQAMKQLLTGLPLTYNIVDKTVVIKRAEPSFLDKLKSALNIAVTVSGKVVDEVGSPLPGVTVRQKGTTNAVVTDANGAYSISVPDNNAIIYFSFVGFETQQLSAKDIPSGSVIRMKASETNLKEVVINKGYYNEKRELSTGNVSVVSAKEIGEQPVTDPILALEGRVPGLSISQTSGIPGAYSTIQLRGQNSIADANGKPGSSNNPLFIIDGVPFGSGSLTSIIFGGGAVGNPSNSTHQGQSPQGLSPFNSLNPGDIESIEILKDADATAIYGSRGANGVILITTKKGKAGDTRVDLNLSQGIGQVTRQIPLLNTQQYLAMRHEAFNNDGLTPDITDYDLNGAWDTTRYTNWQKVLIGNTAHFMNAEMSISGGTTNTQFFINGGYSRQSTVFPGDYDDRKGSLRINLSHSSYNQRFHVQLTAGYVNDNSNLPNVDLTNDILLAPDAPPIYNRDGTLNWQVQNGTSTFFNPLAYTVQRDKAVTNYLTSNLLLSYHLLPGLDLKSSFGYNRSQMDQTQLNPSTSVPPPGNTDPTVRSINLATTVLSTWIIEPQITYSKQFGKGRLDALVGTTFQENDYSSIGSAAYGFANDALITNPAAGSFYGLGGYNNTLYRYNALYSRVGYNWDEKYIINITGRRDGSSRFGPGKQWGNFGALGTGWIFSKEKFVTDHLSWLSFGKLRASYGITGNDQLNDYQYLNSYSAVPSSYQGIVGLSPVRLYNANFGWEVVKKLEGGIELGFLQNKINVSTSYYRNQTSNQLLGYSLPMLTGFSSVESNLPAIIQNSGWEFTLNANIIKTKDFSWSSSANLTLPQNKLVAYPGLENSSYYGILAVGQSLFSKQVFKYTGVDPQTGTYTFMTASGTGTPVFIQDFISTQPITATTFGGWQNNFRYKGFELDFLLQFVKQAGLNEFSFINAGAFNSGFSNVPVEVLKRWRNPGDITAIGKYSTINGADPNFIVASSNYAFADASFIRLKNISLSYDLPEKWRRSIQMRNARIFLQGQNIFTITSYKGLDPETMGLNLPPLRMLTMGIKASF